MRKQTLLLILLGISTILSAQKVDSISVEQTGDFIKIGYQIVDSKPGQIYRVRVLCSINGGLNTEIPTVSGDAGDNVQGGKAQYFALWDVLKDVDELNSAEFIVRAELLRDIPGITATNKNPELTAKWSKKWIHIAPAIEVPGPKPGFLIGVMGSFGAAFELGYGVIPVVEFPVAIGVNVDINEYQKENKILSQKFFVTKRVVNNNTIQMHLMAGITRTQLIFLDQDAVDTPYHTDKLFGPAAGIAFNINRISFTAQVSHPDPGPGEREAGGNRVVISPLTFFSASIGARF
jgi:hypothetical protein